MRDSYYFWLLSANVFIAGAFVALGMPVALIGMAVFAFAVATWRLYRA